MSGQGTKDFEDSVVHNEWANLTPDCLLSTFSKLTVAEMLEGPMQVCKPWSETGQKSIYSVFDFGTRIVRLTPGEEFDWETMEKKMDTLLMAFADRSDGGLKSIKITLCTDKSISYVADNVTDASVTKIATKCTKLKELCVRSSGQITNHALKIVKDNCPDVKVLKD